MEAGWMGHKTVTNLHFLPSGLSGVRSKELSGMTIPLETLNVCVENISWELSGRSRLYEEGSIPEGKHLYRTESNPPG